VNVASAVLLVPIGMIFFGERLSWTRALGIALALAGLILLSLPRRSA
jgi:drug/metabolite transporter (DMT)-like permease